MYFTMLTVMVMIGATLLQALLPDWAVLSHARYPVLLGVVLYFALNHNLWIVIPVAFAAGLIQDGLGFVPLGYSSLLFCGVALVAAHYRQLVLADAAITAIFFGGIASLTVSLSLYLLLLSGGYISCSGTTALVRILGSGLLGTITVPAVFVCMKLLYHALDLQEKEDADVRA